MCVPGLGHQAVVGEGQAHGRSRERGENDTTAEEEPTDEHVDLPPPAVHPDPRPDPAGVRLARGEASCGWFCGHAVIKLKGGGFSIWCGRHTNLTDNYKRNIECSGKLLDDSKICFA